PQFSNDDIQYSLLATSRPYRKRTQQRIFGSPRRDAMRRAKSMVGHLPRKARADMLEAALNLRTSWVGRPDYAAATEWEASVNDAYSYRDALVKLDASLQGPSLLEERLTDHPAHFERLARDPRRRLMPRSFALRASLAAAGLAPLLD